jgi:phosphoribosyl 1,2-cyclic phosphodiesterase
VRGSTPCSSDANRRHGGNTACVTLESAGEDPIVLDLGTGLRFWGLTQPTDGSFRATVLLTHLHWDHVQGLPFLPAIDRPGARLDIYGPVQDGSSLEGAFGEFMRPPFFPVRAGDLRGDIVFHDVADTDFVAGNAKVRVRPIPHCGPTNGYRVERDAATVVYISDHQSPLDGSDTVAASVLELCDGADVLIHDAQFTPEEWSEKAHWGHCTVDYAVEVARQAGVKRLVLFHHDPSHDDDMLDRLHDGACARAASSGIEEVVMAREGLTISLDR